MPVSGIEAFRFDDRRVLVVGGATGMGAAAAKTAGALGAEVTVMDHAPVDYPVSSAIEVDLRDRGAVDRALAQVRGPLHAVFSAAGVADGTPGLMKINFIGHRHIIERMVNDDVLVSGSAVCMVSSVAGLGWESQIPTLLDFLATPDYESADAWIQSHPDTDTYGFSKQVMNCYVARQSYPLLRKGIRINAICPGPTDTPLARANAETWLTYAQDYRDATGTGHLTAEEIATTMAFLNSEAAAGISGVNLLVDRGHFMSSVTGSWEPGARMISMLLNRS
ncbi:MAG: oxidoreductase, short chain dehydrogenase/reductase family protein [Acidimicrobiales bacterium]|jgi:NAD(P)-dependent dehydrogenase (short-subunit alcohol dehydrogenase family)|nr:oxidoreductase, short chain dehydrogenase/reductase family protein [Acidimicrobiales bacterium]